MHNLSVKSRCSFSVHSGADVEFCLDEREDVSELFEGPQHKYSGFSNKQIGDDDAV